MGWRPMGWRVLRATIAASGSWASRSRSSIQGVWVVPGHTQFTRMPSFTWSRAMARVRPTTPNFVAT